jgi:hypothetical protein
MQEMLYLRRFLLLTTTKPTNPANPLTKRIRLEDSGTGVGQGSTGLMGGFGPIAWTSYPIPAAITATATRNTIKGFFLITLCPP